jgi:hypothetical protein
MSTVQLDMFGGTTPSTSPLGVLIVEPDACRCGSNVAVVGSSGGPHFARRTCASCGAFRGWLSAGALAFVNDQIDHIGGRPAAPIVIRNQSEQGF